MQQVSCVGEELAQPYTSVPPTCHHHGKSANRLPLAHVAPPAVTTRRAFNVTNSWSFAAHAPPRRGLLAFLEFDFATSAALRFFPA